MLTHWHCRPSSYKSEIWILQLKLHVFVRTLPWAAGTVRTEPLFEIFVPIRSYIPHQRSPNNWPTYLVLDTIRVYQLTSRSHPSSRERRSPVSVMNMYRSIMVLRAVAWFLLAGFCLEFFALALPLAASDYSRNLLAWNKTRRHSLDSSLVARVPQILTASDIGKRDIAEDRLIYDEAYRKMKNCYQDFQVNSLSLCMLQSLRKGLIWLCPS